jgi:DDE superfamily endonuclease
MIQADDEDDVLPLLALLLQECMESLDDMESQLMRHIKQQQRLNRSLPIEKRRPTWAQFSDKLTSNHFRRMFRMTEGSFKVLCTNIRNKIGDDVFQPEDPFAVVPDRIVPFFCGETKVAISIRMLAGGSYLDLVPLFDISTSHLYKTFHDFIDWILLTFEFPLPRWLREENWQPLLDRANHFAEKSDGIFYGPFAANDGLAIRITSPTMKQVPDPGNYFCRKGFYALNVQAMCDRSKRFLWVNPSNKGSTHDSVAFSNSRLFNLLEEKSKVLFEKGLFIAGDTAYALSPFMITPYSTDEMKNDPMNARDAFNFHLSSCRIYIECAFGELVMRWGIFWRTLLFDLRKSTRIIQATMLLHNFILDNERDDARFFQEFSIQMDDIQNELTRQTGEIPRALVSDNNETNTGGRPSLTDRESRRMGDAVRHRLTVRLAIHDLQRPLQHDMHYNSHGHIYMTS